jgi:hypothetical protein
VVVEGESAGSGEHEEEIRLFLSGIEGELEGDTARQRVTGV